VSSPGHGATGLLGHHAARALNQQERAVARARTLEQQSTSSCLPLVGRSSGGARGLRWRRQAVPAGVHGRGRRRRTGLAGDATDQHRIWGPAVSTSAGNRGAPWWCPAALDVEVGSLPGGVGRVRRVGRARTGSGLPARPRSRTSGTGHAVRVRAIEVCPSFTMARPIRWVRQQTRCPAGSPPETVGGGQHRLPSPRRAGLRRRVPLAARHGRSGRRYLRSGHNLTADEFVAGAAAAAGRSGPWCAAAHPAGDGGARLEERQHGTGPPVDRRKRHRLLTADFCRRVG
jgi:hypothetical protein